MLNWLFKLGKLGFDKDIAGDAIADVLASKGERKSLKRAIGRQESRSASLALEKAKRKKTSR